MYTEIRDFLINHENIIYKLLYFQKQKNCKSAP